MAVELDTKVHEASLSQTRAPTEADHEEARRSGCKSGLLCCVQCVGVPTRGSYYNNAARCVLDVTVQCKILEHAILYRVELHASDTVA